jgi:hypothetical protein
MHDSLLDKLFHAISPLYGMKFLIYSFLVLEEWYFYLFYFGDLTFSAQINPWINSVN